MLATQRSVDSSATELTNGFADRSSEKIHIGSITILDFFIPLELEQREREKAEHCVCVKRSLQWIMPRKWNRNGYAGKVHWSFNSEFLCSWKHCERENHNRMYAEHNYMSGKI
ncbi:hypothetical protein TNCT_647491 [Trichonephila clavata]|uniref:Uncharacterized protein n=1 Tax=Trichonephila clavata TaxID=2740835 RepID=A0A8X6JUS7_TRICU|nr:hypothetical protein TNCT_647491 [Trichonephila clavata]